ncbi:MAG: O-antigen ligase family protein [Bacteroidales bacterium]
MPSQSNPFETVTGSTKLGTPKYVVFLLSVTVISAMLISKSGIAAGVGLVLLPFILVYFNYFFRFPEIGLYTAVSLGFIILGLSRYIKGLQLGMAMDGILFLTYIVLIFNRFHERVDWKPAKKDITLLAVIWFGYSIMEVVNPESRSVPAWLAGMRGISLYMVLMIPLTLLFFNTNRKLDKFLLLWGVFSLLASLKGLVQNTIGVDPWEKAWLDGGAAVTHVLFGKLRIFSFLSDAGQFGANQAYSGVVAIIVSMVETNKRKKIFFLIVGILGLYGMLLSGTRGSISIPLAGFGLYFVLKKNKVVMLSGFFLLVLVFVFFKYTLIGQDNQQIRRMRSAFDPNDASLQVRLENQKKLKVYLASRPMGGGIGHAGVKAQKYLPNAFLSNVATDSWYVLIWAEQGIIGLSLHLFILFYVLIKASYLIMFRIRDPIVKMKMAALASGMFGVMVASYGNAVLGTMPTGMLIYVSMALMLNSDVLDADALANQNQEQIAENVSKSN